MKVKVFALPLFMEIRSFTWCEPQFYTNDTIFTAFLVFKTFSHTLTKVKA